MKVFGVGCVLFRYSDGERLLDNDFSIGHFKRDVIDAIEALENVSNLEYYGMEDDTVGFRSFEPDEDENIHPIPCGMRIGFDLHVPSKAQLSFGQEMCTEDFHVDILYGYDRPIMYCSFDTDLPVELADPAMAVSIVRKFLSDRMKGEIVCDAIGPSPFHAQFSIENSEESSFQLIDSSIKRSGYANIKVKTPDNYQGLEVFISEMNETFSRFYYLITQRNMLVGARRSIIAHSRSLLDSGRPSFLARLKAPFVVADEIDTIHREVVSERLTRIKMGSYLDEAAAADEIGVETPLGRFFDEFREMPKSAAWAEFASVANFFEDRRQRIFGNISVLVGGIVGGVIGALIGATATFLLSKG